MKVNNMGATTRAGKSEKHDDSRFLFLLRAPRTIAFILSFLIASARFAIIEKLELGVAVGEQAKFRKEQPTRQHPMVAWLMSFPNSGTSFTMTMVQRLSLRTTASNYAKEVQGDTECLPVYPNATDGPFWLNLTTIEPKYERPTSYVLTKTHCGGRCNQCGPSIYIETPYSFTIQCLSGSRIQVDEQGEEMYEKTTYDAQVVSRAVHLIRNPFDNVVSRFHHSRKKNADVATRYPASRDGFRSFCHNLDQKFAGEEEESRLIDPSILKIAKEIPCHADFFRYIQWHNLAFTTTEELDLLSHVLHYENYEKNYEETVDELLSFLQLEKEGDMVDFIRGKEYASYFEQGEQMAVMAVFEKTASRRTWENIRHYFEGV